MRNDGKMRKDEYQKKFGISGFNQDSEEDKREKLKAAYRHANDNRKFEIEMFWKRSAYYWTMITVAFAGYFSVLGGAFGNEPTPPMITSVALTLIATLGVIITWAWHLLCHGSKYWQENWENHVDMLEDEVTGPLYKTVMVDKRKSECGLFKCLKGKRFSVSKINMGTSKHICIVWFVLLGVSPFFHFAHYLKEWCDIYISGQWAFSIGLFAAAWYVVDRLISSTFCELSKREDREFEPKKLRGLKRESDLRK